MKFTDVEMALRPMRNLKKENRKYICTCEPMCKHFLYIEGVGRLCKNDAIKLAYSIIGILKDTEITAYGPRQQEPWTYKETQFLLDWIREGYRYGDAERIATLLGRTPKSVHVRIQRLKKQGLLPKEFDGRRRHI